MIHRLGIKSIPVDKSSNGCCAESTRSSIECVPISALACRQLIHKVVPVSLILASSSAIRGQMLRAAGVAHEAVASGVDEDAIKTRYFDPSEMTAQLAAAKALSVSRMSPDAWVIGSDSVVSVAGGSFDKPPRPGSGGRASALLFRASRCS